MLKKKTTFKKKKKKAKLLSQNRFVADLLCLMNKYYTKKKDLVPDHLHSDINSIYYLT